MFNNKKELQACQKSLWKAVLTELSRRQFFSRIWLRPLLKCARVDELIPKKVSMCTPVSRVLSYLTELMEFFIVSSSIFFLIMFTKLTGRFWRGPNSFDLGWTRCRCWVVAERFGAVPDSSLGSHCSLPPEEGSHMVPGYFSVTVFKILLFKDAYLRFDCHRTYLTLPSFFAWRKMNYF